MSHDLGEVLSTVMERMREDGDEEDGRFVGSKEGRAALLRDLARRYQEPSAFKPGDFGEWKDGLCDARFPKLGEPGIVMEQITHEEYERLAKRGGFNDSSSAHFRNYDTLAVGVVIGKGTSQAFVVFHLDPQRLKLAVLDPKIELGE